MPPAELDQNLGTGMLGMMALFARDPRKQVDSLADSRGDTHEGQPQAPSGTGSNSDAENSAAHIADLVRRTAERLSAPSPSAVAYPHRAPVREPVPGPDPDLPPSLPSPAFPPSPRQVSQQPVQTRRLTSRLTLAAGGAAVAVAIVGGLAMARPDASDNRPTPGSARAAPAGYAVRVTDVITDCAAHSRGRTKTSFEAGNCVRATRTLATGQVSGHPAIFVVSQIQMKSVEAAASVKQVVDSTGTGNLNDLLREGRTFPGAPNKMPSSGYASVQTGTVVQVAEAGFLEGRPSSSSNPALRAAAAQVASLKNPQR